MPIGQYGQDAADVAFKKETNMNRDAQSWQLMTRQQVALKLVELGAKAEDLQRTFAFRTRVDIDGMPAGYVRGFDAVYGAELLTERKVDLVTGHGHEDPPTWLADFAKEFGAMKLPEKPETPVVGGASAEATNAPPVADQLDVEQPAATPGARPSRRR